MDDTTNNSNDQVTPVTPPAEQSQDGGQPQENGQDLWQPAPVSDSETPEASTVEPAPVESETPAVETPVDSGEGDAASSVN